MRVSTIPTSIREPMQHRQNNGVVFYRGRTTDATQTELFIDGQPNRRLVHSTDSSFILLTLAVCNGPGGQTWQSEQRLLCRSNSTGGIALGDLDNTTAGVQGIELAGAVLGSGGAAVPKGSTLATTGNYSISWTAVAASGTTPAYMQLRVIGASNATVDWEVKVEFLEAGAKG